MELRRSVLLPYAVQDMFDLVEQAEHYPKFLPWCTGATIFERTEDVVAARLEFTYLRFHFGFETRNPKRRPELLQVRMTAGPFRHLQADWAFAPVGNQGCRVSFFIAYEVADRVLDTLAAPAVGLVSRAMMEAFVKRAHATLTELAPAQAGPATNQQSAGLLPAATASGQALPAPAPAASAGSPPSAAAVAPTAHSGEQTMNHPDPSVLEALLGTRLAQQLSPEQCAVLAGVLSLQALPAKTVLAREGTVDTRLYVVLEGSLGVVKNLGADDESVLATLNKGDFAHELGFLDGVERYASLQALVDTRVLVLERAGLESLVDSHPRVLYGVMCTIVRTVHRIQSRLSLQASELTNYIVKQHGRY